MFLIFQYALFQIYLKVVVAYKLLNFYQLKICSGDFLFRNPIFLQIR